MASVLLVVGALMSGAGLYAVYHGYSIIQVEEGWASVISGATLFAGGILTVALGLVLRVLGQVKAGLIEAPTRVQPELGNPTTSPVPPDVGAVPSSDETPLEPVIAPPPAAPVLGQPTPEGTASRPARSSGTVQETPPPLPPAEAPLTVEGLTPAQIAPAEMHAELSAEPPRSADGPHPADDYKLETPSTAEHDLFTADRHQTATATYAEASSPPMEDWLDRAFAELDRDNPPEPSRPASSAATSRSPEPTPAYPSPALEPAIAAPTAARDALEQPTPDTQTPAAEPDTPSPQTTAPSTSAVIGRYESEGTTYVMFADGSIEAQSASGVYRFASMAELKSYIEH